MIKNYKRRYSYRISSNVIANIISNDKIHEQQTIKKVPNSSRVMVPHTFMWR